MKRIKHKLPFFILLSFLLIGCGGDDSGGKKGENPDSGSSVEEKDVSGYITTVTRSHNLTRELLDFNEKVSMSPSTITLQPDVTYQQMDGFGAAITGSTCFNLLQMDKADKDAFLRETFSEKDGFGFSYIRIAIGCSDFSLSEYTCCDTEGIENFALQLEEKEFVIPILKEILAIRPDIKIMGSPWTCPKWMKVNNLTELKPFDSWTSGHLNPAYYHDYAIYFVKWIEAFEKEGIPIYSVTPQNEPLNRGNSASLFMGWSEQLNFIKDALGPKMHEAGLKTKIYVFDHNYNYDNMTDQQRYPLHIYNDPDADKYVAGAAYHNYGGNRQELNVIHNSRPDKELVFTETSIGTWNGGRDLNSRLLADMEEVALGTVNNWCRGVIVWNLMLDNDRGPNRDGGCQTCYGAVDLGSDLKTVTRNSHYYIISHLSAVVQPGAVRIGTSGYEDPDLIYSAFKNPDNTYGFVIMNKMTSEKTVVVNDGKNNFSCKLPARSIASFKW